MMTNGTDKSTRNLRTRGLWHTLIAFKHSQFLLHFPGSASIDNVHDHVLLVILSHPTGKSAKRERDRYLFTPGFLREILS